MSDQELFVQEPPSFWDRLWKPETGPSYLIARFLILRLLGVVYFIGFLTVIDQGVPLLGSDGLTPAADYLGRIETTLGSRSTGFVQLPSIFWFRDSDRFLVRVAWLGAGPLSGILALRMRAHRRRWLDPARRARRRLGERNPAGRRRCTRWAGDQHRARCLQHRTGDSRLVRPASHHGSRQPLSREEQSMSVPSTQPDIVSQISEPLQNNPSLHR